MKFRPLVRVLAHRRARGFTIMELTISMALLAVLSAMAIPAVTGYVERARTNRAIGDIGRASIEIYRWRTNNGGAFPASLDDTNIELGPDPWGNDYVYFNIAAAGPAAARKDKNLLPVNSDFDFYSKGPNGTTQASFASGPGGDDIVRANNGAFVGVAGEY